MKNIFAITLLCSLLRAPGLGTKLTPKLAVLILIRLALVSVSGFGDLIIQQRKMNLSRSHRITCYRHGGKDLVGTEAFCLQATALSPNGCWM